MLQAHSLLWHYLWVGPNVFFLLLALLIRVRGLHREYPAFFIYSFVAPLAQLVLYAADVLPWVTPTTFWHVLWSGVLVEGLLKFVLLGELFSRIFGPYPSIAKLGRILIRAVGVVLVFVAAIAAAFSRTSNIHFLVSGSHLLAQTIYIIETGLIFFIFAFAAYLHLTSDRRSLGICFGLSVSSCVHLATWAIAAGNLSKEVSVLLDFVNMTAYHIMVLIWLCVLLIPQQSLAKPAVALPENSLELWNRELERLIHQ